MRLSFIQILITFILGSLCLISCQQDRLEIVTVAEFNAFVQSTGYITDAEKFDWSIVQRNIIDFDVLYGITWKCPDGLQKAKAHFPVTQVSYQDAQAYAKWAEVELPSYEAYWTFVSSDKRKINQGSVGILPLEQVNIVGNTWEITKPDKLGRIRLAGGSYLCDESTCNGTNPERVLYVDQQTGNTHIGFAVIK